MAIHIIYAHHRKESFNQALFDLAVNTFKTLGHELFITDLYDLATRQHAAVNLFGLPTDEKSQNQIKEEQAKIKSASFTLLQFPLYWFSAPGIVHNYIEQVWTPGFAYPGKFKDSPLADGRKVLFSLTTQSTDKDFSVSGCNGSMDKIIYPMKVAFEFVGHHVLSPYVAYNVTDKSHVELSQLLEAYQDYLKTLEI